MLTGSVLTLIGVTLMSTLRYDTPFSLVAVYMFVLYYGIAADLSPPVALAAYAGAGIAGADPMRTGMTAMKLAIAGFIVPFIYVFNPMLVLVGLPVHPAMLAILAVALLLAGAVGAFNLEHSMKKRAFFGSMAVLSLVKTSAILIIA